MTSIRVRPGVAADLPQLMAIARHSTTAAQWNREQYESLIASRTDRECLVVVEGDRRRGLGSRLLSEFLDCVRARGATEVYLEVRESNLAARKLYEKWGFVEAGRRKAYYQDPPEDALLLRFSFPQYG